MEVRQVLFFLAILLFMSNCTPSVSKSILVFSKTEGFRHSSIPIGIRGLEALANTNHWDFISTEDASIFNPNALDSIDLVVFLNTTGNILDTTQQQYFKTYVETGHPFLGIHAASDTEHNWPWYHDLIGAYFESHPKLQNAKVLSYAEHPSINKISQTWTPFDEWYNFKDIKDHISPLMMLDESSYEGGSLGSYHPIAWTHDKMGGKMIYLGMGHTDAIYSDPNFVLVLGQSIQFLLE